MDSSSNRIANLLRWCDEIGVKIDPRLQIKHFNHGMGVFYEAGDSRSYIPSGSILVRIPKSAILSVRTCRLSQDITPAPYGLEAQLALSLALYAEILEGPSSRWFPYLQSLPTNMLDLPMFWTVDEFNCAHLGDRIEAIEWLRGTEAEKYLCQLSDDKVSIIDEINRYFYDIAKPVLSRYQCPAGLYGFYRAYSLVSSRAFLVDAYHGLSMVPIADAFNHAQENHVHLQSDYYVCPECGSVGECSHDYSATHDSEQQAPSAVSTEVVDADVVYDMVSNTIIPPGKEVFNTYGEHLTNARLFTQYGFILDVNDNDRLSWSIEEILDTLGCSTDTSSIEQIQRLLTTLVDNCCPEIFSDSEVIFPNASQSETLCIDSDGKISHQLWMLFLAVDDWNRSIDSTTESLVVKTKALINLQIIMENQLGATDDQPARHLNKGYACRNTLARIARSVMTVCTTRKTSIGPSSLKEQDFGDILDGLAEEMFRTRLAISLALSEVSILESCESAWSEIAELL